jgi:hypothetical protein
MIRTVTPIQLIISADSNDIHPPTGAVQTYGNMICLPDYKMATVTLKGYVKRSVQLIIKKMAYQLLNSIIHSIYGFEDVL